MVLLAHKHRVVDHKTEIDATFLNGAFNMFDSRIHALEQMRLSYQDAISELQEIGVSRISEAVGPVVEQYNTELVEKIAEIQSIGALSQETITALELSYQQAITAFQQSSSGYASDDHGHGDDYAGKDHDHDDDYAGKSHDHDDDYAGKGHGHSISDLSGYAPPGVEGIVNLSSSSGALAIDCNAGSYFVYTQNESIASLTFTNLPASGKVKSLTLIIINDATGGRTFTWPVSVVFSEGNIFEMSTAANEMNEIILRSDDEGSTWRASLAGKEFA